MTNLEKLLNGIEVEWKPLGEVATIYGGLTGKSKGDFIDGNAFYISYKNIYDNIDVNCKKLEKVKVSDSERQNAVHYGDILFTGSSETADDVGMSSVISEKFDKPVYLNSFSFGIRFNHNLKLIPEFSKYLFRCHFMRIAIAKTASGVTRYNVSKARFKKILIPFPPISIQKEIAGILDKFTKLEAELEAELDCRKRQYDYYRNKLLYSDISNNVSFIPLGNIAKNLDSMRMPITSGQREQGIIPYYGASGIVDYVKDYIYDGDFLLISEDGANLIARNTPIAFSITGKSWVNNHAHVLEFKTYEERKFVEYYLNNIDLNPYISGAAQPKLNQKNLNSILIPQPYISEQKRIVSILDKFDKLTTSISEGLPAEIELRRKQYEYYRNKLLSFPNAKITQ